MSAIKDVIVTSAADLERAFAPVPATHLEIQKHYEAIAAALNAMTTPEWVTADVAGFEMNATVSEPTRLSDGRWSEPRLLIDGNVFYGLSIQSEYTRVTSWRSRPTGKLRLTVGDFGDRQSFPARKDGSFSYEKIAQRVASTVYACLVRKAKEIAKRRAETKNAEAVARLREEFGLREFGDITVSSSDKPGVFALRVGYDGKSKTGTEEQLRTVLEAFRAVGWV